MHKDAHEHARTAVERAERALQRLANAPSLDDAAEAWDHFLAATYRVYEKLKAGARGDTKAWKWFGVRQDERDQDPLLLYIHKARNCDTHRFEEVAVRHPGGSYVEVFGNGIFMTVLGTGKDGKPVQVMSAVDDNSGARIINVKGPHLIALPVTNKGVEYLVPRSHLGRPIEGPGFVLGLAERTLTYLRAMVADAESLIR